MVIYQRLVDLHHCYELCHRATSRNEIYVSQAYQMLLTSLEPS